MPVGGVVITVKDAEKQQALEILSALTEVEVFGDDDQGHVVAVLETETSEAMEKLIDRLTENECILQVGLTYLNTEDEAELMATGKPLPRPYGFRQPVQ